MESGTFKVFDSRDLAYRSPFGAAPQGTSVHFALRAPREWAAERVTLMVWHDFDARMEEVPMRPESKDRLQETWRCALGTSEAFGPLWYHFRIERAGEPDMYYGNNDRCRGGVGRLYDRDPAGYQLTVYRPDYKTPEWYGGGVTYQIFPDRFHRLSMPETEGIVGDRTLHRDWYGLPDFLPDEHGEVRNRDFFGGSFAGIRAKLPYLYKLGVTTVYFTPIFEAASNHRYDTADYLAVDPMLGTEREFIELCEIALNAYGIRIILDGVFNHTGSDSRYFNAKGTYPEPGAYQSKDSKYYNWFCFTDWPDDYEAWWGIKTLPQVNESLPEYIDFIARGKDSVIRRWLRAGASGWRLDVADELPDEFIEEIYKAVREERPDGVLLGEVWEDATNKVAYGKRRRYMLGGGLDGVMNYPFRNAVITFIRGEDASRFVEEMECLRENYPAPAYASLMNLIGTHDSARALTVLGCAQSDYRLPKSERAVKTFSPAERAAAVERLMIAAAIQFAFPGSPLICYGDEAGMEGFEDPFNRRCYPWGREDKELLDWYTRLGAARRASAALRYGGIRWLCAEGGLLVFERALGGERVVAAVNRDMTRVCRELPWERDTARDMLSGCVLGVSGGALRLELEPMTALYITE
ncbi:MAG: glycoside hydrolase family 13 protein [Oscillospiraceae bacterium]|nr:glycoside hydrolase family 13 protein [Oscillospiraceae bacterium]